MELYVLCTSNKMCSTIYNKQSISSLENKVNMCNSGSYIIIIEETRDLRTDKRQSKQYISLLFFVNRNNMIILWHSFDTFHSDKILTSCRRCEKMTALKFVLRVGCQSRFINIFWLCFLVSDEKMSKVLAFLDANGNFKIIRWPSLKSI